MDVPAGKLEEFAAACRKAASYGLMRCSSGNMSLRIDDERMLVSASRSWMADLATGQVSLCRIADGAHLGGPRPSVETVFHAGILHARPEASVVLHFQTPFATTLVCGDPAAVNYFVIPEIPYYVGPVGIVPYLPPGSPELAEAVVATMADHDLGMMTSHGQVTLGTSFDDAIQRAAFFELACEVIVRSGGAAKTFSAEQVERLGRSSMGGAV